MEVVHKEGESMADLRDKARDLEKGGDLMSAIKTYRRILKRDPHHIDTYNRIMILYRKQKMYAEEVETIDEAIRHFSEFYAPRSVHNATVKRLSDRINKAFGMVDKKGRAVYEPGPIAAWKKRRVTAYKRQHAAPAKKKKH